MQLSVLQNKTENILVYFLDEINMYISKHGLGTAMACDSPDAQCTFVPLGDSAQGSMQQPQRTKGKFSICPSYRLPRLTCPFKTYSSRSPWPF